MRPVRHLSLCYGRNRGPRLDPPARHVQFLEQRRKPINFVFGDHDFPDTLQSLLHSKFVVAIETNVPKHVAVPVSRESRRISHEYEFVAQQRTSHLLKFRPVGIAEVAEILYVLYRGSKGWVLFIDDSRAYRALRASSPSLVVEGSTAFAQSSHFDPSAHILGQRLGDLDMIKKTILSTLTGARWAFLERARYPTSCSQLHSLCTLKRRGSPDAVSCSERSLSSRR